MRGKSPTSEQPADSSHLLSAFEHAGSVATEHLWSAFAYDGISMNDCFGALFRHAHSIRLALQMTAVA